MENNNKNVILIGMPGSGKTTLGQLISQRLNMKFCDVDHYIEKKEGRKILDIFKSHGEAHFRKMETRAVEAVSEYKGHIISSGGGIVKNPQNINAFNKNDIIIFINRSVKDIISDIEVGRRPLLKNGKEKLYDLYKERISLYKKYCDHEVINDTSLEGTVEKAIQIIQNNY